MFIKMKLYTNMHVFSFGTDAFFKKNDNLMPIKHSFISKWNKLPNDVYFKELSNIGLSKTLVYNIGNRTTK